MKRSFLPAFDPLEDRQLLAGWARWVNFGVPVGDKNYVLPGSELDIAISMPGDPTLTGIADVSTILGKGSTPADWKYTNPNPTLYPAYETVGYHTGDITNYAIPVQHVDDGTNPIRSIQQYTMKGMNATRDDGIYSAVVRADYWQKSVTYVNGLPVTTWAKKPLLYSLSYEVKGPAVAWWRIASYKSGSTQSPIPEFTTVQEKNGAIVPYGGDSLSFMFFEPGVGQSAIGGYGSVMNAGPNTATLGVVQVVTSFVQHLKWADGTTTDISFIRGLDALVGENTYLYSYKGSGIQVLTPLSSTYVRLAQPIPGPSGTQYPYFFFDAPSLTVPFSLEGHGNLMEVVYRANFESDLVVVPTGQAPVVALASARWWIGGAAVRGSLGTFTANAGAGPGAQDMTKPIPAGVSTVINSDVGSNQVPTRLYPNWLGTGSAYILGYYKPGSTSSGAVDTLGTGATGDNWRQLAIGQALAELQSDPRWIRRSRFSSAG